MQMLLDLQNLDRTLDEVAQLYRTLTGQPIQTGRLVELPPEHDPVAYVSDRLTRLHEMLRARAGSAPHENAAPSWMPPCDLLESEREIVLVIDLPGVSRGNVKLTVMDDVLLLHAERRPEWPSSGLAVRATERATGMFRRAVPLPARVRGDKIDAHFQDGVLTVRLEREVPATTVPRP
jgi:HSP20 family molecular chaperone IbpA